jgi:hypothetical protein
MSISIKFNVLLLCILVFHSSITRAMIGENSWSINAHEGFSRLFLFEYAAGGTLAMTVTVEPPSVSGSNLQFLLLTGDQLDPILKLQLSDICETPQYSGPNEWQETLGDGFPLQGRTPDNFTVTTSDWYYLYALNCNQSVLSGSLSYIAMNPNGEYLSMSEVPYKLMYIICFCVWLAATVFWTVSWWRYRFFNINLQRMMTLLPFSKALLAIPSEFYWRIASSTGQYPSNWLLYQEFAECLDRLLFFGVLILLARGYAITIETLRSQDKRTIALYLIPLVVTYVLYILNQGLWLFLLVTVYIFIFRYLFSHVMVNTYNLLRQFHILTLANIDALSTPLASKLHMFKLLQVALVMYISVDVVFHLWASIFLTSIPWVGDGMENIMSMLLFLVCAYAFGMRPFNPYYYQIVQLYCKYSQDSEERQDRNRPNPSSNEVNQEHIDDLSNMVREIDSSAASDSSPSQHSSDSTSSHPLSPSRTLNIRIDNGSVSLLSDEESRTDNSRIAYPISSQESSLTMNDIPSEYIPVWTPGRPIPPLPKHPKDWLYVDDSNDAPILILENPFTMDDPYHQSLPPVFVAQHINENADLSKIPSDALSYLPPSLIELLVARSGLSERPVISSRPSQPLRSPTTHGSTNPFNRRRNDSRRSVASSSSSGDMYIRLGDDSDDETAPVDSYDITLQPLSNSRRNRV